MAAAALCSGLLALTALRWVRTARRHVRGHLSAITVDADGREWVGMLGLGTLMSPTSARSTSPSARNFTLCTVQGYRRVFAHPSHHQMRRGADPAWPNNDFGNLESKEIAGLSCERCERASFVSYYFEIPADEFPAILEREDMYEVSLTNHSIHYSLTNGMHC